ncbi:PilC/PilY family type IV pilus protein [Polaromonas jejuensis]|uniref:PilC/PilY family type IV pilus protein n=2 Tax=Polaromonas jejuensis TaxID=457502 RepID=A0ABW0Q9X7_9BURK
MDHQLIDQPEIDMKNHWVLNHFGRTLLPLLFFGLVQVWPGTGDALAATTDVATGPIFTNATATTEVKPNVMFVLDDSGSMDWDFMPDDANNFSGKYGFPSSQCNGVYYNPAITYSPPVDATGTSYSNSSFTSAWKDGYKTGSGTTDLSKSFKADINSNNIDTAQAAYYYVYSGAQTTAKQKDYYSTNGIFYKECNSTIGSTTKVDGTNAVNTLFTKKTVSATSGPGGTDERTNFANWYSYYRTRMLMMKTASGRAFKTLNSHFRVGFMTIDNNASPAFLNIADFDSSQKSNWYTKLYSSVANNSTPLREALANAGRMYAGQITNLNGTTVTNPVQYACQRNYTILSTDGFWNGTDSNVKKLDGTTTMDNQDGSLPRPYNDGATSTSTIVTPYTSTQDRKTVTTGATTTRTWTKYTTTIGASCTSSGTPPNLIATAPTSAKDKGNAGNSYSGSHLLGLGTTASSSNPDSNRCIAIGTSSSSIHPWFCRGSSSNNPVSPIGNASVTDASGVTWYLVSSTTGNTNAASCVSAQAIDSGYPSNTPLACPGAAAVSGNSVTTTPYTQTETISGSTTTNVDRYTASQTTTQTITNGVPGTVGALTPTTPTFSLTSNVSTTTTPATSDVFGSWTAGTPSPNNVCTATASLPAAGTTTPAITSTTTSGGTTPAYTVVATTGPTAGTPTVTVTSAGGTSDTLADVAAYYYNTNLRTSALGNCTGPIISPATTANDLCLANKVPPNGLDTATWQHMTTFTLGLGARGRMVFSPSYLTDTAGDYFDVWKGNIAGSTNCSWQSANGKPCNWPTPGSDQIENVDDLWHAAVNGHGNYFSATDPATLANALSSSLNVIINTPQPGTAAAAATTNPKITSNNNFQFSSYFKSVEWSGELIRQTMSLSDGSVPTYDHMNPDPTKYDWSAQTSLDAKAYTSRNIYTKGTSGLISFTWAALGAASLQSNFTTPNISTSPPSFPTQITGLSQFCATGTDCISATAQTNTTVATGGAAGEALVNFLRGDRSNEDGPVTDPTKFFRRRAHVLGDIVSAQPQYVGPPSKSYADSGYAAFKVAQASRQAVVYAAANDGMLHAFDATTGDEKWAYIPSFVLPKLYTLADKKYSDKHQYFVEGTPRSSDVYIGGAWKTILVGGLDGGGTGYYALDITDPATPVLLWEFTDVNMGYSFGNPEITKLDDGTWVVLLTSGYDNCPRTASASCVKNATGNGQGYLYVLNAATGALINSTAAISTTVGSTSTPSGLARIIAQAGSDNVTKRVYGGDLLGNLWRFTIGSAGYSAQLLATFQDPSGNPQPITSRPQVTTYNGLPLVYVGTGRYLGTSDVGSSLQQTFYAIKDNLGSTSYGNPRASSTTFISKTAVDGVCPAGTDINICHPGTKVRTVTQNNGTSADSLSTKNGWFVDFPASSGELAFTDPKLVTGTLAFSTSVPTATTSDVCGSSTSADPLALDYILDYLTGGAVGTTTGVIAAVLGPGIATAPQIEQLPDRTVIAKYRLSNGQEVPVKLRFGVGTNSTKRVSWRELVTE